MKESFFNKKNLKRIGITALLIIIGFVLQTTLIQEIQIADIAPNLMLILVVFIAYVNDVYYGIAVGMISGFLIDCQYGSVIGVCMLAYVIIGYFCGVFNRVFYKGDYLVPLSMVVGAEIVYSVAIYAMDYLLRGRLDIKFYIGNVILPEIVYTLIIAVLLYGVIAKIYENKEEKGGNVL